MPGHSPFCWGCWQSSAPLPQQYAASRYAVPHPLGRGGDLPNLAKLMLPRTPHICVGQNSYRSLAINNQPALTSELVSVYQFGRDAGPVCLILVERQRRNAMVKGEPPSANCLNSPLFLIGQNSRGNWVVQHQKRFCGGLFVNRAQALKFAMFESGNRPQAVIMVPGILELDITGKPRASNHSTSNAPLARAA